MINKYLIRKITCEFFLWFLKLNIIVTNIKYEVSNLYMMLENVTKQKFIFLFEHNFVEMNDLHKNVKEEQSRFIHDGFGLWRTRDNLSIEWKNEDFNSA